MMSDNSEYINKAAMAIYAASGPWSLLTYNDATKCAAAVIEKLVPEIRRDERQRAVEIVRNWDVKTNHYVNRFRVQDRKEKIAEAIFWGS
jgi:biotin-(acetyl-CoA carboxylase) ligase